MFIFLSCRFYSEIVAMNDPLHLHWFKLPNMLTVSHFTTGISRADLFPVPFAFVYKASAHEQYSTALMFLLLTGSIHYIPL